MLTLTLGIDILFEKLRPETGGETPVALNMIRQLGEFHGKSVAWRQVNSQRLEETMYVAFVIVVIFVGPGGAKRFKVII